MEAKTNSWVRRVRAKRGEEFIAERQSGIILVCGGGGGVVVGWGGGANGREQTCAGAVRATLGLTYSGRWGNIGKPHQRRKKKREKKRNA